MVDAEDNWARKAIRATKGNQSLLGCIVIAMLGRAPSNPPRFIYPTARVDEEGRLFCPLEDRHGRRWMEFDAIIQDGLIQRQATSDDWKLGGLTFSPGTVEQVRDELRTLADQLKLSDADRTALFEEFRKWIAVDLRARKNTVPIN